MLPVATNLILYRN